MNEGWVSNNYFSLFNEEESDEFTVKYSVEEYLPGYRVIGIIGWDNFLLKKDTTLYQCPTVPIDVKYLEEISNNELPQKLEADPGYVGKIKWYIKPVVFGGDTTNDENIIWVDYIKHAELVNWWNKKYREIKWGRAR